MYSEDSPSLFGVDELERMDSNTWIYSTNPDDTARFTLGVKGSKTLACIGVNPSTARPGDLDNTLKSVERIARTNGYDSWVMLNLYPQRATNPNDIHTSIDIKLHEENLKEIQGVLNCFRVDFWAAWGTLIEKRPFLSDCLFDIYTVCKEFDSNWYTFGKRSKAGHPHHPLYLKASSQKQGFQMNEYLNKLTRY